MAKKEFEFLVLCIALKNYKYKLYGKLIMVFRMCRNYFRKLSFKNVVMGNKVL
jgi:hypothetical protein